MRIVLLSLVSYLVFVNPLLAAQPDLLVADFEGETYGEWQVTGEAFGTGPAAGTLPNQMHVEGFEGKRLVNSFLKGDRTTGTLTSPEFTVERKYISFLMGGGRHATQTCINLLHEGKIVRTSTGPNDQPGGSERLDWDSWDVTDLAGKQVKIQIVDNATGGWGHVNVDHILQGDTRRGVSLIRRELGVVSTDYFQLPVKNGATKRGVKLIVEDQIVRDFEIELCPAGSIGSADFLSYADVRAFRGKSIRVEAMLPVDSLDLNAIVPVEAIPATGGDAQQRPAFHFTSRRGWLNDPNGLVYAQGEWHLFYQHNPYGWNWGNMHWGHAASTDLLNWKELPTALFPRTWNDMAFSGSAVVDARNTSGFQTGSDPALVAAYTSTGRGECIVFSNDRGRTWTEFEGNPVVKHQGRDPKLIWHAATSKWVMAVYNERPNVERGIVFHTSPNLKEWTETSRIEGFYECPDLFPLTVDAGTNESDKSVQKWVLYGADGKYLLGDFDGKAFTKQGDKQQVWFGNFYAAQTYDNAPDGRRVQIGWANGVTFPGQPFNQQMTVPVELTLRSTPSGTKMFAEPVREVAAASQKRGLATKLSVDHLDLVAGQEVELMSHPLKHNQLDMTLQLEPQRAESVTLKLCGVPIVFDAKKSSLTCRKVTAPASLREGKLELRVISDNGSLELFVNGGEAALSAGGFPSETDRQLKALATGGNATLRMLNVGDLGPRE